MSEIISWHKFDAGCYRIVEELRKIPELSQLKYIYGIPRGGLVIAIRLSHMLKLQVVLDRVVIAPENTLVVDDIADTGKTLKDFGKFLIATLYYKKGSDIAPNIWIYEKKDHWIVFPWEVIWEVE
jgi:hypoxanthine phosphoribosyltransferase